ncbi:unnamed protein product [Brassica oleracea var. botrytis]|uniref:Uncharacterized protein n=3 Tax=Brassica TaxID=3705 RepID=A0A8S9MPA5_BRACR|nr:hypothetical protein F2Q69_00057271 [Brassica cretica]CAF2027312.1 unnamed protein product [Brassica napus]
MEDFKAGHENRSDENNYIAFKDDVIDISQQLMDRYFKVIPPRSTAISSPPPPKCAPF